jgi:nitronate monooxygenase
VKLVTPFSARLGLTAPIIQAPMAGGPSSQELVAACAAAGALGSFGFAYTQPEEMKKQCAFVRAKTDSAIGVNLFTSPQPGAIDAAAQKSALGAVAGYYKELGLPVPEPVKAPFVPDLNAQLDAVEEIRPEVFTVHLSDLEIERIERLKKLGILVGGSATCIAEARRLEELGFDFVIAQGGEAGGHRGSYLRDPYQSLTGTLALTRLLVRSVKLPVVAAGGIMDGADAPQLVFPAQNGVTGKLRQASAKAGKGDFVALWAGQAAPLARALPAAELIARLEAEAIEAIQNLKGALK